MGLWGLEPEHPTRPAHPTKRPAARPPGPGGPSVRRVTRVLGEYGDRQACLKRIVELKDLHRFSSAGTMIDGLNHTAHETAPWRRILNADRRGWVLIGGLTSDIGVHVHRNAISMCVPALTYVAGSLAVATWPPDTVLPLRGTRPLTGATPPFWDASIGIGEG